MGRRAQRRRRLKETIERVLENQVEPTLAAERAREQGIKVDVALVSVAEDATGFEVACAGCGRTAKLPFDPGQKVGLCPQCVKASGM